jgi:hypothetical protein
VGQATGVFEAQASLAAAANVLDDGWHSVCHANANFSRKTALNRWNGACSKTPAMTEGSTRDTLKQLSALGAGVLLAATPHCGGKSEGSGDDSGGRDRGGASGSAGYGGSYGGVGAGAYGGAYGGTYGGSYGGSVGTGGVGTGGYGGAVGIGGCSAVSTICYSPAEISGCYPDAGVDGGDAGSPGEGGFAGEANGPAEISSPPPDVGGAVDAGVDGSGDVPTFPCPTPYPECVPPLPPSVTVGAPTWNGAMCCYPILACAF